ncbi:656_t:CDS:1, partial [Racocetra persica]
NNLIEASRSNTNLMETSRSNTSTNLIDINNLIKTSEFNSSIDLLETSNLVNLIELIKIQKNELIENNLNEINQQITNIKVNITDNIISMDKENFDQLIKLIIQKDLKIEALNNQNNQNNLIIIDSNNLDNYNILITIF